MAKHPGAAPRPLPAELREVEAVVAKAGARHALQCALDAAARGLRWGLFGAAAWALLWRLLDQVPAGAWWGLLALPAGMAAALCFRRAPAPHGYRLAKQVDADLGLQDRLAGGYDLLLQARAPGGLPDDPFIELALEDAGAAAALARRRPARRLRLPHGLPASAAGVAVLTLLLPFIFPAEAEVLEGLALSSAQVEKAGEMQLAVSQLAGEIEALDDLPEEERQEVLKVLESLNLNESDLKKMAQKDLFQKLKEAGVKIKATGAKGEVIAKALEEQRHKLMQLDLIKKQLDELQAFNQGETKLELGDGKALAVEHVKMRATEDLDLTGALAEALKAPGEAEKEYRQRLERLEARREAERERVGKFVAREAKLDAPQTAAEKHAAMMSEDKEYQQRVLDAVKNPDSADAQQVRKLFKQTLDSELEREDIPRGVGHMLKKYMQ
ncbi:MAG: hypothetical protein M5U26_04860 [Planctomycetota bacterium]|nr:hypothetical protein [Planctomycetota bacterium]